MALPPRRPSREAELPDPGELGGPYWETPQGGPGIGMALVSAVHASLFGSGFRNAVLWVLAGNVRADRFYRIDHWAADGLRRTQSLWDVTVNEIRYQRGL